MRKTIVVTGVGKGFGRDLFRHLVQSYYVVGITRSRQDKVSLDSECSFMKDHFEVLVEDVADFLSISDSVNRALAGRESSVYGLINNAGVRCRKPFLELSIEEIKAVSEVNLFAAVYLSQLLIPHFIANRAGRIINISSILSKSALPDLSAYTISKAAIDGFTRSLTAEFAAQNISCNSILPGFCKTSYFDQFSKQAKLYDMTLNRTPAGRWGGSDELIGVCEMLLGAGGAYINGASIPVDGGWTAC